MRNLFWGLILIALILGSLAFSAEIFLSTRQEIVTAAQRRVDFDETASDSIRCLDTVWSEFTNIALWEVAKDLKCIRKQKATTTIVGTETYFLDTMLLGISWVIRWDSMRAQPLRHWSDKTINDVADTIIGLEGSPRAYWADGDSLFLHPIPGVGETLDVSYFVGPTFLSNGGSATDIPMQYREAIIPNICFLYKTKVQKYDEAAFFLTTYGQQIDKCKRNDPFHYEVQR